MNVELLILDDNSEKIIEKIKKINVLGDVINKEKIKYYDYKMNNNIYFEDAICNAIKHIIGDNICDNKRFFVMLDYQLSAKSEQDTLRFLNTTLNTLLTREDVFLVLYTSVAPSLCHRLFDYLKNHAKDSFEKGTIKCKLFYKPMDLSFLYPPFNYEYKFEKILIPEIKKIKEGTIDEHWIKFN